MPVPRISFATGTRASAPRVARWLSVPSLLVALALPVSLSADDCLADCVDDGRACVCVIDPVDLEVRLTPLGGIDHSVAQPGGPLAIGDELVGPDEGGIVELRCPGGSRVMLHGRFRAVVMPGDEGRDCAFNLLAGAADVLTDQPTQMESGEVVLGSVRTWYGMRVTRSGDTPKVEALVFEGEVEVRGPAAGGTWNYRLERGNKLLWSGGPAAQESVRSMRVTQVDLGQTAYVHARTDYARLQVRPELMRQPGARTVQDDLTRLYVQTLVRPDDLNARLELAAIQTRIGNPNLALRQLDRAEALQPVRVEDRTAISVQRFEAYRVSGQEERATEEAARVRQLDPSVYQRLRLDDSSTLLRLDDSTRNLRLDDTPTYLRQYE